MLAIVAYLTAPLLIAACSNDDGSAPGDQRDGQLGNAGSNGDGSTPGDGELGNAGSTSLTKLRLEHEPVTFDRPTTVHVTVWGHDINIADAGASAVERYAIEVGSLPVELELDVRDAPHTRIEQGHRPVKPEDARYYFSVTVDVGRDGQVCENDFVQNYGPNGSSSFAEAPPANHTIVMKEFGERCSPLDH